MKIKVYCIFRGFEICIFCLQCLLLLATAVTLTFAADPVVIKIISQSNNLNPDGSYQWRYCDSSEFQFTSEVDSFATTFAYFSEYREFEFDRK